ncbi:MAG: hypothetical protein U1C73_05535 [Dietzia sp.]|nr:hypothetical protein [Dietzia sp.]
MITAHRPATSTGPQLALLAAAIAATVALSGLVLAVVPTPTVSTPASTPHNSTTKGITL